MKVAIVSRYGFRLPKDVEEKLKSKGYEVQEIYNKNFRANKDLIDALYEHGVDSEGRVVDEELVCIVDIPDSTTDFRIEEDNSDWGDGIEILWYVVDGKIYNIWCLD